MGQNVAAKDVSVGGSEAAAGCYIFPGLGAEHDSSHQTSGARPTDRANHRNQQQKSLGGTDVQRQECADCQQHVEPGQDEKEFGQTHGRFVNPTSVETGGTTYAQAEEQGNDCREKAGGERNLAAEEDSGELVASITVGAGKKNLCGSVDAEPMRARREPARDFVFESGNEKMYWICVLAVFGVFVEAVRPGYRLINEWTKVQVPASVDKVKMGWREVGEVSILSGRLVGRDEPREQYCEMQRQEKDHRRDDFAFARHA